MASSLTSSARISGGSKLAYPSPFFDIASTYLPQNMREMFRYCEYYYRIHPVIHQAITKMAEYPVTDLIVEDEDPNIIKIWEELFNDQLDYKSFLVNSRLDLNCFGNAYITPFFPFTKTLTCKKCKKSFSAESIMPHWTYSAYRFRLHCPSCGDRSDANVEDKYYVNPSRLKLIRWNVHNIVANGSEFGSYHYFYKTPNVARNEWALGQKHKIAGTPQQFLDAAQKNKLIVLNNQNFYHMKRPSISGQDPTYGMPLMMPVLKDAFLFQIFKKSVEMILLEYAVPFRLLFPQAASASADVIATVPLAQWKRQVESAIQQWKRDPNSVGVLPYPIGKETIGGEAKVFLIGQEMQQQMEILITGMGIPREFIIGGLSWCLNEDSYIHTDKGLLKLSEMQPGYKVSSHKTTNDTILVHNAGRKKGKKLTTRMGFELHGSDDHRVWVLNKDLSIIEKRMAEITSGDYVAIKKNIKLWPDTSPKIPPITVSNYAKKITIPKSLTLPFARILGYMIAEGSISTKNYKKTEWKRASFPNTDPEVINDFVSAIKATFTYNPHITWRKFKHYGAKPICAIELPAAIGKLFTKLGLDKKSKDKTVPEIIRRAPKSYVREFLKGLYEGDGGITRSKKPFVHLTSTSHQLIKEVQLLLLNFGILSSIYERKSRHIYSLYCLSKNAKKFVEEIGFVSTRKCNAIKSFPIFNTNESDKIPFVKEALDALMKKHKTGRIIWKQKEVVIPKQEFYTSKEIAKIINRDESLIRLRIREGKIPVIKVPKSIKTGRYEPFLIAEKNAKQLFYISERISLPCRDIWTATYAKLAKVNLEKIAIISKSIADKLKILLEHDFVWDKVKTINSAPPVPMKDLTIAETHTYQACGIITHNSGSNVSLKMLENTFINDRLAMRRLTKFLMRRISPYIGVRPPKDINFKKFKMADDLQRKMLSFQFNQANKLSDTTLLDECDYDSEKEDAIMKKESKRRREAVKEQMIANAEIQAEAQAVMQKHGIKTQADLQKYQLSLQKELESSGVPPGADLLGMANNIAGKVTQMDPAQAQQYMQRLNASQPQMGGVVQDMIRNMQNTGQGGSFMKPEPEQKPPRRLAQ